MEKIIKRIVCLFFLISTFAYSINTEYKINYSDSSSGKLDINLATKSQMLKAGIAQSYVCKILEFRDLVGGIENINQLNRIKGIGESTCNKLKKYFIINEVPTYKELYINRADDKILKYYGFEKKQIKLLRKYLKENDLILDNRGIKKILTKKQYEKYKDIINYN